MAKQKIIESSVLNIANIINDFCPNKPNSNSKVLANHYWRQKTYCTPFFKENVKIKKSLDQFIYCDGKLFFRFGPLKIPKI